MVIIVILWVGLYIYWRVKLKIIFSLSVVNICFENDICFFCIINSFVSNVSIMRMFMMINKLFIDVFFVIFFINYVFIIYNIIILIS